MEHLHFVCPKTGRDIDVGIDSELETLLRIRSNHVLARCPVCGEEHVWRASESRRMRAAESIAARRAAASAAADCRARESPAITTLRVAESIGNAHKSVIIGPGTVVCPTFDDRPRPGLAER